jgi:hypothetical protein
MLRIESMRLQLYRHSLPANRIENRIGIVNCRGEAARVSRQASRPPVANDPVSPRKIFAGGAFHHRNPRSSCPPPAQCDCSVGAIARRAG